MAHRWPRALIYLVLAVVAYLAAFQIGPGGGAAVLLLGGALAEVAFWLAVFRRRS